MKSFALALILAFCGNALAEVWGVARGADGAVLWKFETSGAVSLTDAELPEGTVEIAFAKSVSVASVALTNRTLTFTGDGVKLTTDGKASAFRLADGNWTFDGLAFEGPGALPDKAHYFGGAIDCRGGTLTVTNCSFAKLVTRFNGGAISARLMGGNVSISDSVFAQNACGPVNGTGGAIYASARAGAAATLRLCDCMFCGNSAQSGGAVTTVCTTSDEEDPVGLDVQGCTFDGNAVDYSGGAAFVGGNAFVSNTLFSANGANVQGGAICSSAIAAPGELAPRLQIRSGTVFRGNSATNDSIWTCGGAIALWGEAAALDVDGRHVVFAENEAKSAKGAYGGAVYVATGTVARLSLAQFLGNESQTGGGAVFADEAGVVVQTSVFSNNTVTAAKGYGGAVAAEGATLTVSNSTVRGSNGGAVDAYRSKATLVNCVVVDNGATDVSVGGGSGAELVAEYTSYGRAEVAEGTPVTTNACFSGRDKSIYLGESLYLDSLGAYLPEACEGVEQEAWDFDGVKYGSRPAGRSMGAFECPTLTEIEIVSTTWYHNRSDGLYYPQIRIRFIGGDAHRIAGVTLTCGGVNHELPETDVARLRAAATGEVVSFGVDPATFVPYPNSPANWGFVPPANRLFGIHDASRPPEFAVTIKGTLRMAEVVAVPVAPRLLTAARMSTTIPVRARFTEFRIGERLSGKIEAAWDATVFLWGCASLGDGWKPVCPLEIDADGGFSTVVPDGLRFFRLEAEVAR